MEFTLSLPLLLVIVFASILFTLFVFSFLVASKVGDEKFNELMVKENGLSKEIQPLRN
ncbi:MAG: hypothetical protein JEY94_03730 [Melioribacteraceae bacterium]|nr:hypothetical protein [Melioribacteraceae bacterium]